MTSLRRLRALLAILLTSVLLAACGSDGGSGSASSGGDSGSGVEESAPDGEWDNDALTKDNFGERMLAAQPAARSGTSPSLSLSVYLSLLSCLLSLRHSLRVRTSICGRYLDTSIPRYLDTWRQCGSAGLGSEPTSGSG